MEQVLSDISAWLADLPPFAVAIAGLLALLLLGFIADVVVKRRLGCQAT